MSSISLTPQVLAPTTVAVGAADTTLATFDTKFTDVLSVQVTNSDAVQVFAGLIKRRLDSSQAFATTTIPDFSAVAPLGTAVVDIDTRGTTEVRITGAMSGAGGNVVITARRSSSRG
jgi:hypothetical protein